MIAIIDYGMGNLGSIWNMFRVNNIAATVTSRHEEILRAEKIVLPGVGSFDNGMKNLAGQGLIPILQHKVIEMKTPVLGICLGMQLMTEGSEEGTCPGLGWFAADTVRFKFPEAEIKLKIPHMGWNTIASKKEHPIFNSLYFESKFYFVHSYHVLCREKADVLAETIHGYAFASVIAKNHIWGVQFHPEKSHKHGLKLLKNFSRLPTC
jgi:glutamine amidotransferase